VADAPTFFVAKDRARRFARALLRVLQERLLGWRGAEIGMTTLADPAGASLDALLEDVRASRDDVVAGRVRDRERPLSDVPFAVMAHGVWLRLDLARRIEEGLRAGTVVPSEGREAYEALLRACQTRLDAFCLVYDEKRPLGVTRPTEVARILERVEVAARWRAALRPPPPGHRAFDRPPPPLPTDAHGFEDLMLAARFEALDLPGPWRVRPADGPVPMELRLGDAAAERAETPASVDRAARVLAFDHGVDVVCTGGLSGLHSVAVRLADVSGGSLARTAAAATGGEARLSPASEKAVRALAAAPPAPEEGVAPPQRLVAILGVLRALDAEVLRTLLGALHGSHVRRAAADLPREAVRKAPVRKEVLSALERDVPGLPSQRVGPVAEDVATGKVAARSLDAGTAALVIALFGRSWSAGPARMDRALALGDWTDEEALETARDLLDVAGVRRDLEAGKAVPAAHLTRLERAAIAVLGRLGRIP
jgi:hypothetical protein